MFAARVFNAVSRKAVPRLIITHTAAMSNQADMTKYKYDTLAVSTPSDFVLHVELNRPDKLNSMTAEMWNEMLSCFNTAAKDENVRSIVLSARGRIFTAGLDLVTAAQNLMSDTGGEVSRRSFKNMEFLKNAQISISSVEKCLKPVICAVHSACIGGGVDLITACDVRYATKDSFFCVKEVDIGLAADIGTLQRLPKVMSNGSLVRELCYTARNMHADEAFQHGLLSRVFDDKETMISAALDVAKVIASKSPVAVQGTKHNLNFSRDHSVDEGLEHMVVWNAAMLQSEDLVKSGQAAMMKKKPEDIVYAKL